MLLEEFGYSQEEADAAFWEKIGHLFAQDMTSDLMRCLQVEVLNRGGIHLQQRARIWQQLLGNSLKVSQEEYEKIKAAALRDPTDQHTVIERDLARTFPQLIRFPHYKVVQDGVKRVLLALTVARCSPRINCRTSLSSRA